MKHIKIPFRILSDTFSNSYALVYGMIYTNIMNSNEKISSLTNTEISKELKLSLRTVSRAINFLIQEQELSVEETKYQNPKDCQDRTFLISEELLKPENWDKKNYNLTIPITLLENSELKINDILVYSLLYQFSSIKENGVRSKIITADQIARNLGVSYRTIYNSIKNLKDKGYINIVRPKKNKIGYLFVLKKEIEL